jgi:hypothetical protein
VASATASSMTTTASHRLPPSVASGWSQDYRDRWYPVDARAGHGPEPERRPRSAGFRNRAAALLVSLGTLLREDAARHGKAVSHPRRGRVSSGIEVIYGRDLRRSCGVGMGAA